MKLVNLKAFLELPFIDEAGLASRREASPLVYHKNEGFELCFSYSGVFTWEVNEGPVLRIHGNQMSLTPPDWEHRGWEDKMNPGRLLYLVINPERMGPPHMSREEARWMGEKLESHTGRVAMASRRLIQTADLMDSLCARICEVGSVENRRSLRYQMEKGILLFICQAMEAFDQSHGERVPRPLKEMYLFIDEHLAEKISLDVLERQCGLGQTRIFELFREYAGQSPGDYIQFIRIREARRLLRETEYTITRIAFDTGYSSSQYFSRVFRKFTGDTPGEYRRRRINSDLL